MKREIKFRAWNTDSEDMINDWCCFDHSGGQGKTNEYIVMQFTGRKDKLKRDLYEGDIVQFNHYSEHGNTGKMIGEIYWNDSEACWSIYSENNEIGMGTKNGLFLGWAKNITLLGNKCEHPELQEEY